MKNLLKKVDITNQMATHKNTLATNQLFNEVTQEHMENVSSNIYSIKSN